MEILVNLSTSFLLFSKALDTLQHCFDQVTATAFILTDIKNKEPSCTEPLYLILSGPI